MNLKMRTKSASQAAHESVYRSRKKEGFSGWDDEFDVHDLDLLMASRYAPSPGSLLDIGCGGGETSAYFAKAGFAVTAFDFSKTAVSLAQKRCSQIGFSVDVLTADMSQDLPFADGQFDVLVDHRAFHCVVDVGQREAALNEFYRVLRPGGFFFSSTIAGMPRDRELLAQVDPVTRSNSLKTRYFGDANTILQQYRSAGFVILGFQVLSKPFIVDNLIVYASRP